MKLLGFALALVLIAAPPAPRLTGRVVDASDNRTPVRRAIVTITGATMPVGRSSITDDEGRFSFDRVPNGDYTIVATRPGFLRATYGATRPGRAGTPVAIRTSEDVTDLVLPMTHGSAIEGTLRDIAGDPAPGMRMEAIRVVRRSTGVQGESGGIALTDDRGGYRIFGLPAGDYVVVATATAIIAGIGDIGAASESEVDAIFAALARRGAAGPPTPGTPRPPATAPPVVPVKTYSTPATYFPGVLQSGEAGRITLGPNEERANVDFALRLSHAAAVDGRIVSANGEAVPQVAVAIRGADIDLPVYGGTANGPQVSMRTDVHTFHISNVPPGRYRITALSFNAPGNSAQVMSAGALPKPADPNAGVRWAMTEVTVGGDDLADIALALRPALRVSGRLALDATGTTARPQIDSASIRIALEPVADPSTGTNVMGQTAVLAAVVRGDGTFEFPAVVPGTYRLTATTAGGWWLRSAMSGPRDVLDGGLTVGAADIAGLALTLTDRHSAIAGALTTAAGHPAPNYFLVTFPTDRALWRGPSRRVVLTRPATSGEFVVADLPAGAYHLAALTDVEAADLEDVAFLDALVKSSLTITLGDGERKRQDVRIGG